MRKKKIKNTKLEQIVDIARSSFKIVLALFVYFMHVILIMHDKNGNS